MELRDLPAKKDVKGGNVKINGNGMANATGKQLLQIVPINIVTILIVIGTAIGLYYKTTSNFEGRISSLENGQRDAVARGVSIENKVDQLSPKIYETYANVQQLMYDRAPKTPRP